MSVILDIVRSLFAVIGGYVIAEVIGFLLHRFAEHYGWLGDGVRAAHQRHHMVDYPADNMRPERRVKLQRVWSWPTGRYLWYLIAFLRSEHWLRVVPDQPEGTRYVAHYQSAGSWTWYVYSGISGLAILFLLPLRDAVFVLGGGLLYAWYGANYLHESYHVRYHWLESYQWFIRLRCRHDTHHEARANYGITLPWMDWLIGTERRVAPLVPEDIFPRWKGLAKS